MNGLVGTFRKLCFLGEQHSCSFEPEAPTSLRKQSFLGATLCSACKGGALSCNQETQKVSFCCTRLSYEPIPCLNNK